MNITPRQVGPSTLHVVAKHVRDADHARKLSALHVIDARRLRFRADRDQRCRLALANLIIAHTPTIPEV